MEPEGEHPAEAGEEVEFPFAVPVQQHLGIAGGLEDMAGLFQFFFQALEVVDFAVEDDVEIVILRVHGLMARCAEVDDTESTMGQADLSLGIDPVSGIVGPAMRLGVSKSDEGIDGNRCTFIQSEDAGNSAHGVRLARTRLGRIGTPLHRIQECAVRLRLTP